MNLRLVAQEGADVRKIIGLFIIGIAVVFMNGCTVVRPTEPYEVLAVDIGVVNSTSCVVDANQNIVFTDFQEKYVTVTLRRCDGPQFEGATFEVMHPGGSTPSSEWPANASATSTVSYRVDGPTLYSMHASLDDRAVVNKDVIVRTTAGGVSYELLFHPCNPVSYEIYLQTPCGFYEYCHGAWVRVRGSSLPAADALRDEHPRVPIARTEVRG